MTEIQALHLIEQFSAQAPFAIWITDANGVAIFANRRLHELFGIQEKPSAAVGINIFDKATLTDAALGKLRDRIRAGEVVDETVIVEDIASIYPDFAATRIGPATLRVVAYPLFSSSGKIEHYVISITDITASAGRRKKLNSQNKDIEVYNATRKTRQNKESQLRQEAQVLEEELKKLGGAVA